MEEVKINKTTQNSSSNSNSDSAGPKSGSTVSQANTEAL
jgi:hypothetical protein